jgi:hypothetical protein
MWAISPPAVLALELLQPLDVGGLHPAVLVAPAVQGLLGDLQGLCRFSCRLALREHLLCGSQLADDLLGGVPLPLHLLRPALPIVAGGKDSQRGRTDFRGSCQSGESGHRDWATSNQTRRTDELRWKMRCGGLAVGLRWVGGGKDTEHARASPNRVPRWAANCGLFGSIRPSQTSNQSGRPDLNRGPHRPERCALPGCATPRRWRLSQSATRRAGRRVSAWGARQAAVGRAAGSACRRVSCPTREAKAASGLSTTTWAVRSTQSRF